MIRTRPHVVALLAFIAADAAIAAQSEGAARERALGEFASSRVLDDLGMLNHRAAPAVADLDGDRVADVVLGADGRFVLRRGLAGAPRRRFAAAEELRAGEHPARVGTT